LNTRYFFLVIGIVLVACSVSTESPPTALTEPTTPPEPTSTPTEMVETELPPSPAPTETQQPTPTQIPTETPPSIQFNLVPYEDNPIIEMGAEGEWDQFQVIAGQVVISDNLFHMFYSGSGKDMHGIGYAVSTDGREFTKHNANPIFQPDGEGFDAIGTSFATPLVMEDTWMLFYNGSAEGEVIPGWKYAGSSIGLTTAPEPTGPWTPGQLVLNAGGNGEWDAGLVIPSRVIATEDGYIMYYTGGPDQTEPVRWMCGMASSSDGINWTKYDDPNTTEAPFAESDPILQPGDSWDSESVHCSVLRTDSNWEMFFEGWGPLGAGNVSKIGYATSQDGVDWTKYPGNPILYPQSDPAAHPLQYDELNHPSAVKDGSIYYLFYSYLLFKDQGVAFGTIEQP
jgi:predicted GH43/DUF377 family glycosyl hydrolase